MDPKSQLQGINGQAFVDLEPHLDTSSFAAMHEEICMALATLEASYTGGCHRSMGIMPQRFASEPFADYGEVIPAMTDQEFLRFASLGDDTMAVDPQNRAQYTFGEERAVPLSNAQMRYLEVRFGVYFPWKTYIELMPGGRWVEKANPEGKHFTRTAMLHFPRTVAFVRSLPFAHLGSVKLLGLAANDHGTVHRDHEPNATREPDHFVSFCPMGDKELFVWDEGTETKTVAPSRAYWFNDGDYHGVSPAPFFRYSIRVDGAFEPAFLKALLDGRSGGRE